MIRALFFSMFLLLYVFSFGQELKDGKLEKGFVVKSIIIDGDTLPLVDLPPFEINDYVHVMTPTERWYWDRLVYNVKTVLPYAKLAGVKLREYNTILSSAKNETEKKRLMKQAEKELKAQFGKQLMDLTFNQGEILMKLVYRETGNSTYDIVKELRGSFIVFFYQNIGRLFGYNLKVHYDPNGKDHQVATVVYMIENGLI
jgi:hypothetical protein